MSKIEQAYTGRAWTDTRSEHTRRSRSPSFFFLLCRSRQHSVAADEDKRPHVDGRFNQCQRRSRRICPP